MMAKNISVPDDNSIESKTVSFNRTIDEWVTWSLLIDSVAYIVLSVIDIRIKKKELLIVIIIIIGIIHYGTATMSFMHFFLN